MVAGGTESMSRVPYLVDNGRWGLRMGNQPLTDGMYRDGFFCPLAEMVMGETAENLATMHKISRDEQDEFAVRSQNRAATAQRPAGSATKSSAFLCRVEKVRHRHLTPTSTCDPMRQSQT